MSIFLDRDTRIIVQGITGKMARFHAREMIDYGSNVVGGVVPGKGGETVEGVPVFNTVKEAVAKTGAEATLVFVPPPPPPTASWRPPMPVSVTASASPTASPRRT